MSNNKNQPASTPLLSGTSTTTNTAEVSISTEKLSSLQRLKWINLVAYVVNCIVTYAIGAFGSKLGLSTNAELSAKYQSLITPAGFTFAIWGIIFLLQLIWVVYQFVLSSRLTNNNKSDTVVTDTVSIQNLNSIVTAVGYNYVWIVLTQATWTIVFTFEYIGISVLAISSILLVLLKTTRNLYYTPPPTTTTESACTNTSGCASSISSYFITKAPFTIHCGWVTVATIVNVSLWLVYKNYSTLVLYYTAIGSLVVVALLGTVLIYYKYVTIPIVFIWALYGIVTQAQSADNTKIIAAYSTNQITTIATMGNSMILYFGIGILVRQLVVALYYCRMNKK